MAFSTGMAWDYSRGVACTVLYTSAAAAKHGNTGCLRPGQPQLPAKQRNTKVSLKFVRRLSKLLSTSREPFYGSREQLTIQPCIAEVHQPYRTQAQRSEAKPAPVSRRKILASLEEDDSDADEDINCEAGGKQRAMHREDSYEVAEDGAFSSFSGDEEEETEDTNSESSSGSFSGSGEERFSRCFLLRSLGSRGSSYESGPASPMTDYDVEDLLVCNGNHHHHHSSQPKQPAGHNTTDNDDSGCYSHSDDDQGCLSHCSDDDKDQEEEEEESNPEMLELSELRWVCTLGVGGFGRVELVTAGKNNNTAFALKKMKKAEICDDKQQQHILREKSIMASCHSPFIVKLYRTYRDSRYLYMLMEPCLGGELWTILRNRTRFQDAEARFYTACVIRALEYLHDKGILYRDLKPENLLLDAAGYVKLTDFGFSKQLTGPEEKSWTFCGTPEYVAPEIITNKSHDFRADIWSVGILMYELLTGAPPFTKKDNNGAAQVYVDILKGMRSVSFPGWLSSSAVELMRQLCRLSPAQRPSLSVARRYMWFAGFDWEALGRRALPPPFTPKINGCVDSSNFDNYVEEQLEPEEDFSDWDLDF